jgi:hypothetical protein
MQPTDINARIAKEVMGWEPVPYSAERWRVKSGQERDLPDFEHSLDACALAEAEIDRRGLWEDYQQSLYGIFRAAKNDSDPTAALFMNMDKFLIRLTPAQRCQAMLSAVSK